MADTSTVVGQTILIKGNLEGDEDLTVQGRIEGAINLSKTLIVEPSGVVKADVSVSNAVVSGVMVGNLTASDSVEISDTGRMVGDIKAPRVIIVEGALFKGNVDMGNLEMPRPASTSLGERKPSFSTPVTTARRPTPVAKRPAAPPPKPAPVTRKPAPPPPKREEKKKPAVKPAGRPSKKKVVVKKKRR
jgi:cytoskeletal protein CcmA (bactofilin family)